MSAFDKVIGYTAIKQELLQVCDMIKNREIYKRMGAKPPRGILLSGEPGLGKTLLSRCFVEESGLPSFVIRRDKANGEFISFITESFRQAKEQAPSVLVLDDMDKFANEDHEHKNAPEYIAVQAGIDTVADSDVYVFATVNDYYALPDSLRRAGRFDKHLVVEQPSGDDAVAIIKHYLTGKKLAENVSLEDLSRMISYSSCAELEAMINEAAILAAFQRKETIGMEDLIRVVLRVTYHSPDSDTEIPADQLRKTAIHEAGHLVVCEALLPESVGFASVRSTDGSSTGGFIHRCKKLNNKMQQVLVSLAGKAAVDLYYADVCPQGAESDIRRAVRRLRDNISEEAALGFWLVDVSSPFRFRNPSENMNARSEAITQAELERCMTLTKNILLKNRDFLEKTAAALVEKGNLLASDIREIKRSIAVSEAPVF